MESNQSKFGNENNDPQNQQLQSLSRRNDEDLESNMSYASSNDDDPILTATITFDVTVDPNGQVISTSEGQIISESFQSSHDDGRPLSLADHQLPMLMDTNNSGSNIDRVVPIVDNRETMQADSLTSMNSQRNSKDLTTLHDSLDEQESDSDDSTSTSTESLIERSKSI